MTFSAPATVRSEQKTVALALPAHHDAFSRASHYAMAMVPMILAVATMMIRDFQGQSAMIRVLVFAGFVFSISSVLFFLRAIDQLQDKNL